MPLPLPPHRAEQVRPEKTSLLEARVSRQERRTFMGGALDIDQLDLSAYALDDDLALLELELAALEAELDDYAPLESPALTGNPTAPTQPPGNRTTRLATTEFAQVAVEGAVEAAKAGFTFRPQVDYVTLEELPPYTVSGGGSVLTADDNGDLQEVLGLGGDRWTYDYSFSALITPYAIARSPDGSFFAVSGTNGLTGQYQIFKFDSSGTLLLAFGSTGTGDGQFSEQPAYDLAIDPSGNIFAVDRANHRVQKFNSSGAYQSKFGTFGTGNGQFSYPRGIALDASGNIFVTDGLNRRVQKFNSSGTYQSQFGGSGTGGGNFYSYAEAIAIDSTGAIYVTDGTWRVQKFNSSGVFQQNQDQISPYGIHSGLAVDSDDNVYVTDSAYGAITCFDSSGNELARIVSPAAGFSVRGIAADDSRNLYVAVPQDGKVNRLEFEAAVDAVAGEDVLVNAQGGGSHPDNGIYEITDPGSPSTPWVLTRRDDADTDLEFPSGLMVNARFKGSQSPGGTYYVTTPDPITIGTTPVRWEPYLPGGYPTAHGPSHAQDGDDPIPMPDWGTVFSTVPASAPATTSAAAANRMYFAEIKVLNEISANAVRYIVGATSSGNVRAAIYDKEGNRLANRSTNLAQSSIITTQDITFDAPVTLGPGRYYVGIVFSSNTATFIGAGTFAPNGYKLGPGGGATVNDGFLFPADATQQVVPVMALVGL